MYAVRPTAASPLPAHNLIEIGGGLSTEVNALSLLFRVKKAGGGGGPKSNHEIREGEKEEEETIIFREKEVLLIRLLLLFSPLGGSP